MNKAKTGFLTLIMVLLNSMVSGQLPDGVTVTQSFLNEIIKNYKDENSISFDPNTINTYVKIPMRVHIIMDIKGTTGVNLANIFNSVVLANTFFKNAGIQFFIDSLDLVSDYNYSFITYNKLRKELLTRYVVNNRINLFLADSIKMGISESYGFTYFPDVPDSNFIFLNKKYLPGNSLTTMLGHYMGLLSTHETMGGRELVSEINCSTSGDYICDTYADPDLFNSVIDSCKYIGTMRDDNGRYFVPTVANIMSNTKDECKCILTPLQYRRINYYYKKYRQNVNN
jgi:hypothetical protein